MDSVQRFGWGDPDENQSCADLYETPDGPWVKHADHQSLLAAKEEEIARLQAQLSNGEEMYVAMRGRCAGVEADLFRCQEEYERQEADLRAAREQLAKFQSRKHQSLTTEKN